MDAEIIEIPQYTKTDFMDTNAPFEFLYQFCGDAFTLSRMEQKMKDMAWSVGVRSFRTTSLTLRLRNLIICLENCS